MNGRLYDPVVGRFLSPDPFIQDPSFSQSYNRYAYALNNPLKFTDYSGEKWNWNNLNPFYHFQNFMQWVNDKTPGLRQNMVNAKVPNFGVNYNTIFGTGFSVGENPAYYPFYENKIADGQQGISTQIAGFSDLSANTGSLRFGNGDIPSKVNFDSNNIVDELLKWYEYRKESKDPFSLVDMFMKKTFSNYGGWYVDGKRKAIYQGQIVEIRVKNILDLERNNQSLYINSVNYADDYFNANKTIDFFLGGPQCGNCRWPTNYVNIRFYSRGTAMDAYFQVYGYYPK